MFAVSIGQPIDLTTASEERLMKLATSERSPHRIAAKAELKRRGFLWHSDSIER